MGSAERRLGGSKKHRPLCVGRSEEAHLAGVPPCWRKAVEGSLRPARHHGQTERIINKNRAASTAPASGPLPASNASAYHSRVIFETDPQQIEALDSKELVRLMKLLLRNHRRVICSAVAVRFDVIPSV